MKLIGRGWQYSVYDLGNGRVIKRYNSWFEAFGEMLREQLMCLKFPVLGFAKHYGLSRKKAGLSMKIIANTNIDLKWFGNPKILGKYEYEQDMIQPLSGYFASHNLQESQEMIEKFIKFCLFLRKSSIIEKHFNMADNFGINKAGEIVLMDLGEICSSPDEIARQITKRVWAKLDVLAKFPENLNNYFVRRMDEEFGKK